jgi:hypothetical protein
VGEQMPEQMNTRIRRKLKLNSSGGNLKWFLQTMK